MLKPTLSLRKKKAENIAEVAEFRIWRYDCGEVSRCGILA
jgi:hypothetical protein